MRIVVEQFEVGVLEVKYVFDSGVDLHLWQCVWSACQLQFGLIDVIAIEMHISKCMHEVSQAQLADLRDHHGEESI